MGGNETEAYDCCKVAGKENSDNQKHEENYNWEKSHVRPDRVTGNEGNEWVSG